MTVGELIDIISSEWNRNDIVLAYDREIGLYVPANRVLGFGGYAVIMSPNDDFYLEDSEHLPRPAHLGERSDPVNPAEGGSNA